MITRRFLLQSAAAAAAYSSQGFRPVWAANAPGITDTEIKIGQTCPIAAPRPPMAWSGERKSPTSR